MQTGKIILWFWLVSLSLQAQEVPAKWENEISAFEKADSAHPPAKGGIVFTGSSSIRYWENLGQQFPGKNALNRGFGGSQIVDLITYVDRVIFPYAPRQVVIYSGDNDIADGKSAEEVADDFAVLFRKIRSRLPEVTITYISIKPSPSRRQYFEEIIKANNLIKQFIKKQKKADYVNVFDPMLNAQRQPRGELFRADSLHMNEKGYSEWASLLKRYLK